VHKDGHLSEMFKSYGSMNAGLVNEPSGTPAMERIVIMLTDGV